MALTTKRKLKVPGSGTDHFVYTEDLTANVNISERSAGYDPISYGADPTGVADSRTAFNTIVAAITVSGTNETIEVSTGTYKISSNLTIPEEVTLKFQSGAKFSIDTGIVITIAGAIDARMYQIFSGLGTVSFTGNYHLKEAPPQWWGAVGDYSTDCHLSFESCATACATGSIVMNIPVGRYKTTATISIPANVPITQEGTIYYSGSAEEPCLVIGTMNGINIVTLDGLRVARITQSDWTDESNIGIRIYNIYNSRIAIDRADNFTIGVQLTGYGTTNRGFGYNNVYLGLLGYNKIGLDLNPGAMGSDGWVNENIFYNGRFSCGTENPSLARYGLRITGGGSIHYCDNNDFRKPSFELLGNTDGACINIIDGFYNIIRSARYESTVTLGYDVSGTSERNDIDWGLGLPVGVDTSTTNTTRVTYRRYDNMFQERLVFDSGFLPRKLVHYDNGGYSSTKRYYFQNLHLVYENNGNTTKIGNSSVKQAITPYSSYVYMQNSLGDIQGLGFFVDTSNIKKFIFRADTTVAYSITIKCYDVNGAAITTDGTVKGISNAVWAYSATHYTGFYCSASTADKSFSVSTDTKKIQVVIAGNNVGISRFSLYTQVGESRIPKTWSMGLSGSDYDGGVNQLRSTLQPSRGFFETGERILNANGGYGWTCTQRLDTTLKTPALVATDVNVNVNINTSNLLSGDVIGILLDDTTIHWTTVASITDADTIVITDAIPTSMAVAIGNTIYTMRWTSEIKIAGALNHDGSTVGLFGTAPTTQPTGFAVLKVNYTTGDLDSEAEVISAINTTNTALNTIRTALNALGITTTV
jgi:hypothetical protein